MGKANLIIYNSIFMEESIDEKIKGLEELREFVHDIKNKKQVLDAIFFIFNEYHAAFTDPGRKDLVIDANKSTNLHICRLMSGCMARTTEAFCETVDKAMLYLRREHSL